MCARNKKNTVFLRSRTKKHYVYCVFALQDKKALRLLSVCAPGQKKAIRLLCFRAPGQKKHYVYCAFALQDKKLRLLCFCAL